jgi:hypothetical protein
VIERTRVCLDSHTALAEAFDECGDPRVDIRVDEYVVGNGNQSES